MHTMKSIRNITFVCILVCTFSALQGQSIKLDSLLKALKKAAHDSVRCDLYLDIGDVYLSENSDSALYYYNKCLTLAESKKIYKKQAVSLRLIGSLYADLGEYDKVMDYYLKSLAINEKSGDKTGMGRCYNYIGNFLSYQGNYDEAMEYYIKSLKISEELNDKTGLSIAYNNISLIYADKGSYDTAMQYILKSLQIDEELGDKEGMSSSYLNIGLLYSYMSEYDKAMEHYLKALEIKEDIGDKSGISDCYTNIGLIYDDQGNFDKAIEYYLKSLKIDEQLGDKDAISDCYLNIGVIYANQDNCNKALEYYLKSIKIKEELGDREGISDCYSNIGNIHANKGNYAKAIEYYQKSLEIDDELGNKAGLSDCYSNIGRVHADQGNLDKAMEYYHKALYIKEELEDKKGKILVYKDIASLHVAYARKVTVKSSAWNRHLNEALQYGHKAIEMARDINAVPFENEAARILKEAYRELGNYKKALEYADVYIATGDSLKSMSIADAEAKFNTEKKQLEIDNLNKEKELQQSEILRQQEIGKRQRMIIFFFITGVILITSFAAFVVQRLRISRKQKRIIEKQKALVDEKNILLREQNEEIRSQRDEIENQRDEIATQRDMVTEQRDNIEKQKLQITDSINYAKRIQQAVLPASAHTGSIMGEHFILFKPKDIVSGDFYWATKIKHWLIIGLADCTGHGVPGAFMSMLGISFLNEIVSKKEVTRPDEILNQLRTSIMEALQQTSQEGDQKDGMDIALCSINTHTRTLQFAGAFNSLYIMKRGSITNNKDEAAGNNISIYESSFQLDEIKGDKMPIAIYENMTPFTNHAIKLNKGDCIYMASDGYEDQFGGPDNKKFKIKQLRELLVNIAGKPMREQNEILDRTFENWRSANGIIYEQVDDVTILGMRI
ncbi:MAG: tetratricopeptide repeat protein [Bacteroidales bacterium]|nr:tetratricopeptide repeat protein [Bacteroidales bacterium]